MAFLAVCRFFGCLGLMFARWLGCPELVQYLTVGRNGPYEPQLLHPGAQVDVSLSCAGSSHSSKGLTSDHCLKETLLEKN